MQSSLSLGDAAPLWNNGLEERFPTGERKKIGQIYYFFFFAKLQSGGENVSDILQEGTEKQKLAEDEN